MAKKVEKKKAVNKGVPIWIWIVLIVSVVSGIFIIFSPKSQAGMEKMAAEISVEDAAKLRDQGALILDVREQSEWDQFHIPEAKLIPLGSLSGQLASVPKDKTVVVVCRTGRRSAEGRDILIKAGYTNVTSMAGGVTEWQAKGLPVEMGK